MRVRHPTQFPLSPGMPVHHGVVPLHGLPVPGSVTPCRPRASRIVAGRPPPCRIATAWLDTANLSLQRVTHSKQRSAVEKVIGSGAIVAISNINLWCWVSRPQTCRIGRRVSVLIGRNWRKDQIMGWTLVTGSTGTVGAALVRALRAEGRDVRCLVRNIDKAASLLPAGVDLAAGDVTDPGSLAAALRDCSAVFHAAGLPEQWHRDPGVFARVNGGGTANLVEASMRAGVSSFVYTSTQDLFDVQCAPFDETSRPQKPMTSAYEISKTRADALVEQAIARGLPAIFIHPSAVYGPTPGAPTGTNRLLADLLGNRVPMILPGGLPLVLSEDLARAQLLAEAKGAIGARYLVSESFHTLKQIAQAVQACKPGAKVPPVLPLWVANLVARGGETISRLTQRPPLLTTAELAVLRRKGRPDTSRARQELGWRPTPFPEGLARTLTALERIAG
jgi:dihydroflavonol-4-reductase